MPNKLTQGLSISPTGGLINANAPASSPATTTQAPGNGLDPQAIALAKSIRQTESGGNFNAKGKSGEWGAYQFRPDTWAEYAHQAGVTAPWGAATPDQQNEVAYKKIKQWKDEGYNVGQIASMWNAGPGKPNAYKEGHKGVNDYQVGYDTPAYAQKVAEAYQQLKGVGVAQAATGAPEQENPSFTQDVSSSISNAAKGAVGAFDASNDSNIASKVLQSAGAVAGGLGDLTSNVLEHTPILGSAVKGIEEGIGGIVRGVAGTGTGQKISEVYRSVVEPGSEMEKNLGAGLNVLGAIPLFKGLTLAKTAVKDVATTALKSRVTKAATDEIKGALTTKGAVGSLARAEGRGMDPVKLLTKDKNYLPDVVEHEGRFVYNSDKAVKSLSESLNLDEDALQKTLQTAIKKNIGVDLKEIRQQTLKDVAKEYQLSGSHNAAIKAVNDYFDSIEASSGGRTFIDLNELNAIKRDVRDAVFDVGGDVRGSATANIKYQMGQSLMDQVEKIAAKAGATGVDTINRVMGEKLEALKILRSISGKAIKNRPGLAREAATSIAGVTGEGLGNLLGVPLAGTFAGRGMAGLIGRRLPKTSVGRLKAQNPPTRTLRKAVGSTGLGLGLQSSSPQQTR